MTEAESLVDFINNYQPLSWKEPLKNKISGLEITIHEYNHMSELANKSKFRLRKYLESHYKFRNRWPLVDAVLVYFGFEGLEDDPYDDGV